MVLETSRKKKRVVGVDPDKARIKLAQNTYKDVLNAQFVTGDSEGRSPCDNERHFVYHISTNVYLTISRRRRGDYKPIFTEPKAK